MDMQFLICKVIQTETCYYDIPIRVFNSRQAAHRFLRKSSPSIEFSCFTIDNEGILTCIKGPNMRWD